MADPNWDQTKFDQALDLYLTETSRTRTEAINTKAFYVARKSLWFTTKTGEDRIITELMQLVTVKRQTGWDWQTPIHTTAEITLATAIVQKRGGRQGADLRRAVGQLFSVRLRSRAFLASGWLPAIRALAPVAKDQSKAFPTDNSVKRLGAAKGSGTIANDSSLAVATIINSAIAKRDKKDSLARHGGPALQQAFDDETADMIEYLDKKLAPATEKANKALS